MLLLTALLPALILPALITAHSTWCFIPTVLLEGAIALQLLFAIGIQVWKQLNRYRQGINIASSSPCQHCYYFSNNPDLFCALHPFLVLRQESEYCLDYSPNLAQSTQTRPAIDL